MRADSPVRVLDVTPGGHSDLLVDVVNDTSVIDGITTRVIGLPAGEVVSRPALLSLFPEAAGSVQLSVGVPRTFPAGRHPVTVEVSSSVGASAPAHVDLELEVEPRPDLAIRLHPAIHRVHRRGRYTVECINRGNVELELALRASDPDRCLHHSFSPAALRVGPGESAPALLRIRGPRHLFGSDRDRQLTVVAESVAEQLESTATATLRQRPVIPRGLLTAAVLAAIVGLWAVAFLVGMQKVFNSDPMTKQAPASFFVTDNAVSGLAAGGSPVGALPKSGQLPAGVGGSVTGTVTATSTQLGVGRIVVEALQQTSRGLQLVTSAATQADGTYALVGLFPGSYYLRFTATGFQSDWYPDVATQAAAKTVDVAAQAIRTGVNQVIGGLPATITGGVDPGQTLTPVVTVVTVQALQGNAVAGPIARTVTDASGAYTLKGLPAPGQYQLGFTAPGYQPTTVVETVGAGETQTEPTVRLSAGAGTIAGVVTDGHAPLGGVTVSTTVSGQQLTSGTPTLGAVGHFTLSGLATPGTYVLTFAKQGYGAQNVVIDLGPGQADNAVTVALVGGTGTVSGQLVDSSGAGLGGATVSVGGAPTAMGTTTLTTGQVGAFAVSGLPDPGSYTLTFALPGYTPATVPITLDTTHAAPTVSVTLTRGVGQVGGQVLAPNGTPSVGATVTITDGAHAQSTVTVDTSGSTPAGSFLFTGLAPGAYSVTASRQGYGQQTTLVHVTAGKPTDVTLTLTAAGG